MFRIIQVTSHIFPATKKAKSGLHMCTYPLFPRSARTPASNRTPMGFNKIKHLYLHLCTYVYKFLDLVGYIWPWNGTMNSLLISCVRSRAFASWLPSHQHVNGRGYALCMAAVLHWQDRQGHQTIQKIIKENVPQWRHARFTRLATESRCEDS